MRSSLLTIKLMLVLLLSTTIANAAGWEPALTSEPTRAALGEVYAKSDSDMVVVGGQGVILHFDGTEWKDTLSGTSNNFNDVTVSGKTYYCVGHNGTIVKGDGVNWTTPDNPFEDTDMLIDIETGINGEIYIAGYSYISGESKAFLACWDGTKWSINRYRLASEFYYVRVSDSGKVYVGSHTKVYQYADDAFAELFADKGYINSMWIGVDQNIYLCTATEIWKGKDSTWNSIHNSKSSNGTMKLFGFDNAGNPLLRGGGSQNWTYKDGVFSVVTWLDSIEYTSSIYPFNNDDYVVVGSGGGLYRRISGEWKTDIGASYDQSYAAVLPLGNRTAYLVSNSKGIFKYENDEVTLVYPATQNLKSIAQNSDGIIYAVGYTGTIIRLANDKWELMPDVPNVDLEDVWCSANGDVYACGQGKIIKYDGNSWTTKEITGATALTTIWGQSATDLYSAGLYGQLFHYNGESWVKIDRPGTDNFYEICGSPTGEIYLAGADGYRDGPQDALLLKYKDGAWTKYTPKNGRSSSNVHSICYTSSGEIYTGGNGGIRKVEGNNLIAMDDIELGMWLNDIKQDTDGCLYAVGGYGAFLVYDGCSKIETFDTTDQPGLAKVEILKAIENTRDEAYLQNKYATPLSFKPKTSVREFTATTSNISGKALFKFRVNGISGPAGDLVLYKLLNNGTSMQYSPYDSAGGAWSDQGTWWIKDNNGIALATTDSLVASEYYDVSFVIEDNGPYDLDSTAGLIRDPFVLGSGGGASSGGGSSTSTSGSSSSSSTQSNSDSSGGSSGCVLNPQQGFSGELPALLAIALLALFIRRMARRQK